MKFLDRVRTALAAPAAASGQVKFLSPYDDVNHLWPIIAPDWLPAAGITRSQAMSVPAVKRARGIICTTIARIPLRAYMNGDTDLIQPSWLDRTDGPVSPYHRMVWTVDDLLFHGWSLWAVSRHSGNGSVVAADRVPFDRWHIESDGSIVYRSPDGTDTPVDPATVVLIPGSDEGLLTASAGALRHAADLLAAASSAAANPAAYLDLHQTNEYPITEDERDRIIGGWRAARRGENGGVAFSSAGIEVRELGTFSEHLLVEGRNASALDVARAMSLPGTAIDATVDKSSLNYENTESKAADLIDYGLSAFMSPITARLGMDDMVPAGVSIRFDLSAETGPQGTAGTPDDGGGSTASTAPAPDQNGVNQ